MDANWGLGEPPPPHGAPDGVRDRDRAIGGGEVFAEAAVVLAGAVVAVTRGPCWDLPAAASWRGQARARERDRGRREADRGWGRASAREV